MQTAVIEEDDPTGVNIGGGVNVSRVCSILLESTILTDALTSPLNPSAGLLPSQPQLRRDSVAPPDVGMNTRCSIYPSAPIGTSMFRNGLSVFWLGKHVSGAACPPEYPGLCLRTSRIGY